MKGDGSRSTASFLGVFVFFGALCGACRARETGRNEPRAAQRSSPPPNVLLITVDTLRPDALGWVAGSNATREIDRVAHEGFAFPAAVAPAPLTLPSHASILTGLLPRRFGIRDNGQLFGVGPATLAELLGARGYETAAFVSGYPIASDFGLDRGFGLYDDRLTTGSGMDLERPAGETTAAALEWLGRVRRPWFAWVHYYDPHYPYEPPSGFRRAGWRGSYDGEVAYVDEAVGRLRAGLAPASASETLTVFASDHGESLGEHGEGTHGFFLYESTVRVPVVFHFPGRVRPGGSLAPVRLADITPTVLELVGAPPLSGADGVSLVPTLEGRAQAIPYAYIETYQPWTSYGWSPLKAVRHEGWKLIAAPTPELYDLESDPAEEHNLVESRRDRARQLAELQRRAEAPAPAQAAAPAGDSEAAAKLRALGYLGGGASLSEPPARGLRDPKDSHELRNLLTEADQLLRSREYRAAVSRFDAVLARDPENRFALLRSGSALLALGDPSGAIPRLEKAARLDPANPEAQEALVEALTRAGRHGEAVEHGMEAVRLQPRRAKAWAELGTALGLSGKAAEAVKAFEQAVELEPGEPKLLARLAFAEHGAGRRDSAARHLLRLAEMTGESFEYAGALGVLLVQLGRRQEARSWLARSRPGEGDYAEARLELALLEIENGDRAGARRSLQLALAAAPQLRRRVAADPRLARLVP